MLNDWSPPNRLWKEVMRLLTDHDVHLLFMKWSVAWRVSREVCNLCSHSHWRYDGNWNLNVVGRQIIEPIHGELKFMCRGSMQNQDFCFSLLKLEYHNFFWVSETGVEWSRNYQKTAESLNILFGLPVCVIFWYHNRIKYFYYNFYLWGHCYYYFVNIKYQACNKTNQDIFILSLYTYLVKNRNSI